MAEAVVTDGAGVYVTGHSRGADTGDDYATVAYDAATGYELWVRRYNGPGGQADRSSSVAAYGTRIYVTGESVGSDTDADYATVAYDAATGAQLWVRRYRGAAGSDDIARSLATDGPGVYVTGQSLWSDKRADYATVAYDADSGAPLWVGKYDGPGGGYDDAQSVATDGTGVYVTGHSLGPGRNGDYATLAYDAASGARIWIERYYGPGHGYDDAHSVATDGQGVYVAGESRGSGTSFDYATVVYQALKPREPRIGPHWRTSVAGRRPL